MLVTPAFANVGGSTCTTSDPYLPGGTATMCWTCTSGGPTAPNPECLDQVALGYPDGWAVACGSQDAVDSAGNPVAFSCTAAGQTVTFADSDGGAGEVCPERSWSFCVDVTAPVTETDPICAFYTVSGDGAGGQPHDVIDCGTCLPAEGTVTIVNETQPADAGGQLFDFSGDLGAFSLTSGQSTTVAGLGSGSYDVSEALPAGWDLTQITCDDPDGGSAVDLAAATATIDVDPGEHITCTFLNIAQGSVTIIEQTDPMDAGGQAFDFAGDLGALSLTGGQSFTVTGLGPGSYDVSQLHQMGWDLTQITCSDPDGGSSVDVATASATLDVDPGEHITCTFLNVAQGAVTIVEQTDPADAGGQLFDFSGDLGVLSLTGGQSITVTGLGPGSYDVTQSLPAGWNLTQITCDDPDGGSSVDLAAGTATIDVDAGEQITCTFLNTETPSGGSVTIVKETVPEDAGGQMFAFVGDLGALSLTGGQSTTVTNLEAGSYDVTETLPAGWDLTQITCVDPDGGSTVDLATATATIDVDDGELITCTFLNTSQGSVTIVTQTVPEDSGGQLFFFAGDLGTFTLTGGQSTTVTGLGPGRYDVVEGLPPGWDLTQITCNDPDGGSTVDVAAGTATIDVDGGEHITCTFLNTAVQAESSVTIMKQTLPQTSGGQLFDFTGDFGAFSLAGGQSTTMTNLAPGVYDVAEVLPADWELTGITCDDPDGGTTIDLMAATASLDVDADEDITCTFRNTSTVTSVTIVKQTLPPDAAQLFDFSGDFGPFSLSGGGATTFDNLEPGTYTVTESMTVGWGLVWATCADPDGGSTFDDASATVAIDVDAGEQIVCTFVNRSDDYVPQPIPTLSAWMLLLLVGILAAVGVLTIRH
jgi:plastocyanin